MSKVSFSIKKKNSFYVVYKESTFLWLFKTKKAIFKSKDVNKSIKILESY